jgi:DNA-binding XRE family transcriptional regulator
MDYWDVCLNKAAGLETFPCASLSDDLNFCCPLHQPETTPDASIRKSKNVVEVPVDSEVAFSFLVRYYRIQHGMIQHQVAKKLGFDNVNSYQRLERRKCNPSLKILSNVKAIFPEFSLDFAVIGV